MSEKARLEIRVSQLLFVLVSAVAVIIHDLQELLDHLFVELSRGRVVCLLHAVKHIRTDVVELADG